MSAGRSALTGDSLAYEEGTFGVGCFSVSARRRRDASRQNFQFGVRLNQDD
jgi:hypothetical protein